MNRSRLSTLKFVYHDDEIDEATMEERYCKMNKTNMRPYKSGAAIPSIYEVNLYNQSKIFEKYDSMDLNRNRLIDPPLNARDEILQYEARDQNKMGLETYDQSGRKNNDS